MATIKAAEDDAEVLSVSNQQRMLSQRILFLMYETDHDHDPHVAQRLESALNRFEVSHEWLVSRPDLSPALRALYFDKKPISLDAFSRRFIQMVGIAQYADDAEAAELQAILAKWGMEDLVSSLATAAYLFKQESEARITRLQQIQQLTLVAALLVLLIEALVIFLPAQVSVNSAIRRLERRKAQLKRSMQTLKTRNDDLLLARQSLTHAANHDPLTGLLNRRAIYDQMNHAEGQQHQGDYTRCIMKIDLDHFKQINDTLGHSAGDHILTHVARILEAETSTSISAGRIGGDEFIVMADNPASVAVIRTLGKRIVEKVSKPLIVGNTEVKIGASVGFTLAVSSAATPDQLLIEADLALYEAKRAGRGQVFAYSEALAAEIESRRVLFKEITDALADDHFEAYLQPQVYTKTGALYGCEVLARWRHPQRGIVPPATFIAAAEEAGLVGQIDRVIMGKGLDILEDLTAQGFDIPCISINASPQTLRDPHLPDRLLQEVRARHLSPSQLTVEVLESTLIENDDDEALRTIENLSAAGFNVFLDDFGTGYASMSNLSRLKLNGIKLDQSLVKPVPEPRADSIISALVTLARSLDMSIIAEGVETAAHLCSVQSLGCDVVQGFGIGKPMPKDAFMIWLQSYHARGDRADMIA